MQHARGRRLVGTIVVGVVASACATIMSVDEPRLRDDVEGSTPEAGPPLDSAVAVEGGEILDDGGCLGEGCPCTGDPDCRAPFVKCESSRCVQCTKTPTDTCPAGSYCTDENACAIGCRTNEECETLTGGGSPFCDVSRHRCVACLESAQCPVGMACSPSGTCTNRCGGDAGSCTGANQACCNGFCIDTAADPLNCGGCGAPCSTANGLPSCNAGVCAWTCNSGFTHCQEGNSGCETNTASDPAHCGTCTTSCATTVKNANGILCSVGNCSYTSCSPRFANCDGNRANGCECACGGTGQACCTTGSSCFSRDDRCGGDAKCHACSKKGATCSPTNDICCNGCGGNGKCK